MSEATTPNQAPHSLREKAEKILALFMNSRYSNNQVVIEIEDALREVETNARRKALLEAAKTAERIWHPGWSADTEKHAKAIADHIRSLLEREGERR